MLIKGGPGSKIGDLSVGLLHVHAGTKKISLSQRMNATGRLAQELEKQLQQIAYSISLAVGWDKNAHPTPE